MVESWHLTMPALLSQIEELYPGEVPLAVPLGYDGGAGEYISKSAMDTAQRDTGLSLEYYKSYAAMGQRALEYFDNTSALNLTDFLPCNGVGVNMNDHGSAYRYWKLTGDDDGVLVQNNTYSFACPDGHIWKAPSCRGVGEGCILYVTAGNGWSFLATVQRSAVFSMPLGVGTASSWNNYLLLPKRYKTMTYAWTPDDSFLDLQLQQIIYPPHNAYAFSQGDESSSTETFPLATMVSYDLEFLAPDVLEFFKKSAIDIDTIYKMMAELRAGTTSPHEIACQWLKSNEQRRENR